MHDTEHGAVERRDAIRRLDALTHAHRRIRDAADRLDGYYALREGLIPVGSDAAGLLYRWDVQRARMRALADEAGTALREAERAVIVQAIDAARGLGYLDGHAIFPAAIRGWVATYLDARPLPILFTVTPRVEGRTSGERIDCYVALGYATEVIGGRVIRTPDMTALIDVHDHSPYMGPSQVAMKRLIDYRGKGQ